MSGVWVFKNGVVRLVENPVGDPAGGGRRKVLVHIPTNEAITSYQILENKLRLLGWERYLNDPDILQFHQRSSVHLISLPRDFSKLKLVHMYDIVVKTRNVFEVLVYLTTNVVHHFHGTPVDTENELFCPTCSRQALWRHEKFYSCHQCMAEGSRQR